MSKYKEALKRTAPETGCLAESDSAAERDALSRYESLFARFSAEQLRDRVRELYAGDAFFRDSFVEIEGAEAIEEYLVRSAQAVDECALVFDDVVHQNGNHYLRWSMTLRLARYKDEPPDISVGMTHLRINREGRIVFHQDFWDTMSDDGEMVPGGDGRRWSSYTRRER